MGYGRTGEIPDYHTKLLPQHTWGKYEYSKISCNFAVYNMYAYINIVTIQIIEAVSCPE